MKFFGWAMGMNRWLDETGMFHAIVDRGNSVATPACGTPLYVGGIEGSTERGQKCRTCQKSITKADGVKRP